VAELHRRAATGRRSARGRYVASLIWPDGIAQAANDNRAPLSLHRLLPLAATIALLTAAVWAVVS
jgi:hypothetical protein